MQKLSIRSFAPLKILMKYTDKNLIMIYFHLVLSVLGFEARAKLQYPSFSR